jgi:hypothetical protein
MKSFWTKEEVDKFFHKNTVDTGGAITKYKPKISHKQDGDEWIEIHYPVWRQNPSVQRGIAKLLHKFSKKCTTRNGVWYINERSIVLAFDLHYCDPD